MSNVARNYRVGLAISLAVPASAPQKETVDPNVLEQLAALRKTIDDAWSKNDAAALAATYTEDAVLVTDTGPVYGQEAHREILCRAVQAGPFQQPFWQEGSVFPAHINGWQ